MESEDSPEKGEDKGGREAATRTKKDAGEKTEESTGEGDEKKDDGEKEEGPTGSKRKLPSIVEGSDRRSKLARLDNQPQPRRRVRIVTPAPSNQGPSASPPPDDGKNQQGKERSSVSPEQGTDGQRPSSLPLPDDAPPPPIESEENMDLVFPHHVPPASEAMYVDDDVPDISGSEVGRKPADAGQRKDSTPPLAPAPDQSTSGVERCQSPLTDLASSPAPSDQTAEPPSAKTPWEKLLVSLEAESVQVEELQALVSKPFFVSNIL